MNLFIYLLFILLFKDGDFLVRESQGSPGQYVLTGMNNNTPKHLLLIDPEGVVSIKWNLYNKITNVKVKVCNRYY